MSSLSKALGHIGRYHARLIAALPEVQVEMELTAASNLKGTAYDGVGSRPTGISDPTGAAVCSPNKARTDSDELAAHILAAARHLEEANTIASNYRRGDPAKLRRNLASLVAKNSGDPGCQRHARIGAWLPIYRTGTASGNLAEPAALCRSCYDFTLRNRRPPSLKELHAERRTGKLRILQPAPKSRTRT